MEQALEIRNLGKQIGKKRILSDVGFTVGSGEIVGLVGKNGAGKSSILKCASGIWQATEGEVLIFGNRLKDAPRSVLREVGALVEYPALFPEETLRQNISLLSAFCKEDCTKEAEQLIDFLNLSDAADRKIKTFSSGMRQKACLLTVLMKKPRLIILDEPTSMLDPAGAAEIRTFLLELNRRAGTAILISSHNLAELERLCSRVVTVDGGRITGGIALTGERKKRFVMQFATEEEAQALRAVLTDAVCTERTVTAVLTAKEFREICKEHDPAFTDLSVGGDLELAYLSKEV